MKKDPARDPIMREARGEDETQTWLKNRLMTTNLTSSLVAAEANKPWHFH